MVIRSVYLITLLLAGNIWSMDENFNLPLVLPGNRPSSASKPENSFRFQRSADPYSNKFAEAGAKVAELITEKKDSSAKTVPNTQAPAESRSWYRRMMRDVRERYPVKESTGASPTSTTQPTTSEASEEQVGLFKRLYRWIMRYKAPKQQYAAAITYNLADQKVFVDYYQSVVNPEAAYGAAWTSLTNQDISLFFDAIEEQLVALDSDKRDHRKILDKTKALKGAYKKVEEALSGITVLLSPELAQKLEKVKIAVSKLSEEQDPDYNNFSSQVSQEDIKGLIAGVEELRKQYPTKEKLFEALQKRDSTQEFALQTDIKNMVNDIAANILRRLYRNAGDIKGVIGGLVDQLKSIKFGEIKPGESIVVEYTPIDDAEADKKKQNIVFTIRKLTFKPQKPPMPPPPPSQPEPTPESKSGVSKETASEEKVASKIDPIPVAPEPPQALSSTPMAQPVSSGGRSSRGRPGRRASRRGRSGRRAGSTRKGSRRPRRFNA